MNDPNDTALAEQPVSLEESLSAAYDDAAPTSETTNDVVTDTPHHFGGEQQQAQPQALEAPQHWSQQDREFFTRQTPEAQKWLWQRHRSMEGDYTRKQQEAAEWRRQNEAHIQYAEQARPIWDSLAQRYARQGITPVQIQQMSAAWVQRLNEDPKAALLELAHEFNVDPAQLMEQQDYIDPQQQQLQQVLQRQNLLEQTLQQRDQQQQQFQQQEFLRQQVDQIHHTVKSDFDAMLVAKDQRGQPAFPHLEAVRTEMSALLRALDGNGQPLIPMTGNDRADYAEAYRRALLMRPDVSAPQRRTVGKTPHAARLIAQGLSSDGGGQSRPATTEEALRQAFDSYSQ